MTDSKQLFTLTEYLDRHQINLTRSQKYKLAMLVSLAYKDTYQEEPADAYRPNERGKFVRMGKGYPIEFSSAINKALKEL